MIFTYINAPVRSQAIPPHLPIHRNNNAMKRGRAQNEPNLTSAELEGSALLIRGTLKCKRTNNVIGSE